MYNTCTYLHGTEIMFTSALGWMMRFDAVTNRWGVAYTWGEGVDTSGVSMLEWTANAGKLHTYTYST